MNRLISPAEVRDAARQATQDQSTWRDGSAAVAKMVAILTEPPAPSPEAVENIELKRHKERLEYALGQIGFYFAGTDHQNITDITLRVLAGESMQEIRKSIIH